LVALRILPDVRNILLADALENQMTPEEEHLIQIFACGLIINIVWFVGLLFALAKVLK
jgi:hypothetical protein